ncbi:uncharacterized protein LOC108028940 [Drosophila biarmipes]|uniref:uncharacterized protein LOC108028940 n=1 Tax=Drosophila biarmipes TaxID=125945 RepID=UPI0007E6CCE7|nr:uncharacterized protein LOC108028940 [Drosophila biarmipes]
MLVIQFRDCAPTTTFKKSIGARILLVSSISIQIRADFEYTNIKCTTVDASFSTFEHCLLKSVNRTYKYGSLKVNLHQLPVDKLNLALYKRLNGSKPFLYNVTIDACKFVLNRNSSPVAAFIYSLFSPYSHMNHPCPYNHDVMVDKAPTSHLNHQLTNVLPFPKGHYGFSSIWHSKRIKRAYVNGYGTLS